MGFVAVRGADVKSGGTNTMTSTLTGNTTAGNTVVLAAWSDVGNTVTAVSGPRGNTWNVLLDSQSTGANVTLVYAFLTTALQTGDVLTVTLSATTTHAEVALFEYSGLPASPVDVPAHNFATATTTVSVGPTAGAVGSSDLVVTACASGANSQTLTSIPGYTVRSSGLTHIYLADATGGAAGSTFSATWTFGTSTALGAVIQSFKQGDHSSGATRSGTGTITVAGTVKAYRTIKTRQSGSLVTKAVKYKANGPVLK